MTWSILARDPATGEFGVAVATRFFAVGALCPHGDGRFGVLATQALINPLFGRRGMRMLEEGLPAQAVLDALIASDEGRDQRQLHVMDAQGRIAQFTGAACIDWCGHVAGENVSVAGNMLAGADVIRATRDAYLAHAHLPMAERLVTALEAGEAAGGDKRGKQSAALRIWTGEPFASFDIRVDDSPEPLVELRRLWRKAHQRYVPFQAASPTRENPAGLSGPELDKACAAYTKDWNERHPA